MSRSLRILAATCAFGALQPTEAAEETQTVQELRELRQTMQAQAKQIEALTQQIAKLTQLVGGSKDGVGSAPAPSSAEATPPAPVEEVVPKAEAVPQTPKHVVMKGETLTSIAKHYSIPLVELQKANKIEDGRKLQIGQTLLLPAVKAPEPPEKKDNP